MKSKKTNMVLGFYENYKFFQFVIVNPNPNYSLSLVNNDDLTYSQILILQYLLSLPNGTYVDSHIIKEKLFDPTIGIVKQLLNTNVAPIVIKTIDDDLHYLIKNKYLKCRRAMVRVNLKKLYNEQD